MHSSVFPLLIVSAALCLAGCSGDELDITDDPVSPGVVTSDPSDPQLSWSASSFEALLGVDNGDFPTLTNPFSVSVTYASSNPGVATVSESGVVTLVGAGETRISATSEETATYQAASVYYILTVSQPADGRKAAGLSWPQDVYNAVLGASFTAPVLQNPNALAVTYSSSAPSVATVSDSGEVTLVGTGSTTITATSEATDDFYAGTAAYSLWVHATGDEGAETTVFPSSGDPSTEDDISTATFTRTVTVTFGGSEATVKGASKDLTVEVSGNYVRITNSGKELIVYKLTGSASAGCFTLYSERKQALWLSGLLLTNPEGAAINNQSPKRTYVYVEGANSLADGPSAAYAAADDEDLKGVFFSEGQLVLSGAGTLGITASNSKEKTALISDDYVRVMDGPTLSVAAGSSAGNGVRGKDYVRLSGGKIDITVSAAMKKGISSDDFVLVEGGVTTISVSGGVAKDSDSGEYKGSAGIKADNYFRMTGGSVTITNSGKGGKGISAGSYDYDSINHKVADSQISGGTLSITTTGTESNDVSCKGIKVGWVTKSGSGERATVTGYAGNLVISGGVITVNCSHAEGIEAKGNLTFTGGETYVYSTGDDAINCQAELNVNGGFIYAHSTQNDAVDANHDLKLNGGFLFAVCTKGSPEVAVDANTEGGYKLCINSGATLVAYGGLENGYSAGQSVYSMNCTAGAWNALSDGSACLAAFKAPSGVSSVAVSAPSLAKGYTGVSVGSALCNGMWATAGISGGSEVSLSTYTGGQGGPGGGPGGGGGGWRP